MSSELPEPGGGCGAVGVGTQASSYEVTARHRRRRPALRILTPPANPGLRVATATEPQLRVPHARAVGRSQCGHCGPGPLTQGAPGVEAASASVSGAGKPRDLQRPPAWPTPPGRGRAVSESGQRGLYLPLNKYMLRHGGGNTAGQIIWGFNHSGVTRKPAWTLRRQQAQAQMVCFGTDA